MEFFAADTDASCWQVAEEDPAFSSTPNAWIRIFQGVGPGNIHGLVRIALTHVSCHVFGARGIKMKQMESREFSGGRCQDRFLLAGGRRIPLCFPCGNQGYNSSVYYFMENFDILRERFARHGMEVSLERLAADRFLQQTVIPPGRRRFGLTRQQSKAPAR